MVGKTISHYQILEKLGEGGMGVVYKARDTRLGRSVAIKVVNAEFNQRFEREARAISALNHPHICTLHDVGEHDGAPYLVMEYVEGEPLKGPLPVGEALRYAIQTAQALAAAHKAGIVHRDLKPDDILLTGEGSVKVLDFGLAKLQPTVKTDAPSLTTMTEQGAIAGTGPYMSPEQAQGEAVDPRSDLFSFGAVLYELLSGRRAFRGETMGATLAAVIAFEPPPLKEAPAEVARVVGKMLAKKREDRYQSAEELLAALESAAAGAGLASRRRWLSVAAALVLVFAVAAGFDVRGLRTRLMAWMRAPSPSIKLAVLPFANLTGDPGQEYFSDGLTQEVISQLGRLHPESLSVIARTTVMNYKKSGKSINQIGRELGVDYILEASTRQEAGRVRVSAELIRVRNQTQLWAESYEREMAVILALQSDLAKKVAGSLALKLLPAEEARLANVRSVNPEAYDAYLRGMQDWYRGTRSDIDSAQKYFDLALTKDPNYAPAYAGIALAWALRYQAAFRLFSEALPKAKEAALKALALDETSAEAHLALSINKSQYDWDFAGAEVELKRALELNPSFALARGFYSHYLMCMRRPAEAMAQIQRALELDPLNPFLKTLYAPVLLNSGRYDEAVAVAPRLRGRVFELKGMYKEGYESWRAEAAQAGDREIQQAIDRGYAEGGLPAANRRVAEVWIARYRRTLVTPMHIANLYDSAGDKERAIEWFEKAIEVRDPSVIYLGSLPLLTLRRDDPRFQSLLRRIGLPP